MTDPFLLPYLPVIEKRNQYISQRERLITDNGRTSLYDIADYHLFFGLHHLSDGKGWIFREWAPNATAVYIIGMMTDWKVDERFKLFKRDHESESVLPEKAHESEKPLSEKDHESGKLLSESGIWERTFFEDTFRHGDLYRLKIFWNNMEGNSTEGDRIPSCATRVVQDPDTLIFNAQVWNPEFEYKWNNSNFNKSSSPNKSSNLNSSLFSSDSQSQEPLLIYEAHAGMAQEEGRVGSFREFEQHILPRIKDAGYNAIQLMAVQEHPYYGSFGYHVSNFFALSSRFGTPHDFKSLVDAAHGFGIKVIMDIVHSHAVSNEVEGLSRFDGTLTLFFHDGDRGFHRLWGSRCFDYSKQMVVRFLLSNCRYWLEEYNVDGFRFDGITSMLYKDHGIERSFTGYADYFIEDGAEGSALDTFSHSMNHHNPVIDLNSGVDLDALCYLYLANTLIHKMVPSAITIAEDVSGYPGLAAPQMCVEASAEENTDHKEEMCGIGFDYRFAMGIPDFWIKLLKEYKDEQWPLGQLWYELNARRDDEKTISYAECHDQALVGDQTIMMRLMGDEIYSAMSPEYQTVRTFRGVALHKMVRLITLATAGDGYLNFMGNEFGHPEWIDFPGAHNRWSYHFARRQWSLRDNDKLYFHMLAQFDQDMINLAKRYPFLGRSHQFVNMEKGFANMKKGGLLHIHEENKIIAFKRNAVSTKVDDQTIKINTQKTATRNLVFIFNFNPLRSFQDYMIDAPAGKYREVMNSDEIRYGGKGRLVAGQVHFTLHTAGRCHDKSDVCGDNHTCEELSGENAINRLSLYLPARSALVLLEEI
ncbi:MAG: alpha amylase C-terminal domain-containing protein [Desulfamplus sp.]|nr:alpha amylase C-terminal domain-containing protein [Desulfamplus sp.]